MINTLFFLLNLIVCIFISFKNAYSSSPTILEKVETSDLPPITNFLKKSPSYLFDLNLLNPVKTDLTFEVNSQKENKKLTPFEEMQMLTAAVKISDNVLSDQTKEDNPIPPSNSVSSTFKEQNIDDKKLIQLLSTRPSLSSVNDSEKDKVYKDNFNQAMIFLNKVKNYQNFLEDKYFKNMNNAQKNIHDLILKRFGGKIKLKKCDLKREPYITASRYTAKKRRILLANIKKIEETLQNIKERKEFFSLPLTTFKKKVNDFYLLAEEFKKSNKEYEKMVNNFLSVMNILKINNKD